MSAHARGRHEEGRAGWTLTSFKRTDDGQLVSTRARGASSWGRRLVEAAAVAGRWTPERLRRIRQTRHVGSDIAHQAWSHMRVGEWLVKRKGARNFRTVRGLPPANDRQPTARALSTSRSTRTKSCTTRTQPHSRIASASTARAVLARTTASGHHGLGLGFQQCVGYSRATVSPADDVGQLLSRPTATVSAGWNGPIGVGRS